MAFTAPGFPLVAVAAAATLALTACSSTGSAGESRTALQSYSCCSSEDILAVRHPGEVMTLHWITTPAGPSTHGAVTPVRLEASLSGPFASISELKRSESSGMVPAPVVVTTNRLGDAPVSVIVIPEDAQAGPYNLTWTVDEAGGQVSASSVIQLDAKE
jgi:hypothetical protein